MKKILILFSSTLLGQSTNQIPTIKVQDTLHNQIIIDEYRNFENLKDPLVSDWITKRSKYSIEQLHSFAGREKIYQEVLAISQKKEETFSKINVIKSKRYFYLKLGINEKKPKLYYRDNFDGEEKFIFSLEDYKKEDNKQFTIRLISPNHEGTKVAIAITELSSEIGNIIVYDLVTNRLLPDVITNTWPNAFGGIQWLKDDSGIIYCHIPVIDKSSPDYILNVESVLHKLGTPNTEKKVLFSKKNNPSIKIESKEFCRSYPIPNTSYFYAIVGAKSVDCYLAKVDNIDTTTIDWKPIYKKEDIVKDFQIFNNEIYYISEKYGKSCICKTSIDFPEFNQKNILVSASPNEYISEMAITNDGLFYTALKNGIEAKFYSYSNNQLSPIELPIKAGNISINCLDKTIPELTVICSGWTKKSNRYCYNIKTKTFTLQNLRKVGLDNYDDIIVEEIETKTHDGLDLPLTIIYQKGLKKNKKNRTLIKAYGGFGTSYNPGLSEYSLIWVKNGGVLAYTHVRGGGEKGEEWHKGGFKKTKPNSWKDVISSTEYLIKKGYTSPKYIALTGESAGAITVGRAMEERPELFKAVNISAGLLNPLRSESSFNGANNTREFGSIKNKEEFEYIKEMDPYYNIKKGVKYPAIMVLTGMNDGRVAPWHSVKFVAKLEQYKSGNEPVLLYTDNTGHDNSDLDQSIIEYVDELTFYYWQLGHPDFQIKK